MLTKQEKKMTNRLISEKQWLHVVCLVILVVLLMLAVQLDGMQAGMLWGISTTVWFWIAVGIAIAHQVNVWFCWRTQLHANLLSRVFGRYEFSVYAIGFSILGLSRVVVVFILAIANRGTLPGEEWIYQILAMIALVPAFYLFYSVKRYFGFRRAFGIDHFDESYRNLPFVRKGIFRYTRNGMYVYGFLILWVPALWYASHAALVVAMFNHLYIWVHYYATELPDIRRIYG